MRTLTADITGCIFFLLVGCWFLVNALFLSGNSGTADVGPSAFPILSASGIIIASVFYIVRALKNKQINNSERLVISNKIKVLVSIGVLVLYILAMEFLGYYISSIIFIPLFLMVAGVKRVAKVVSVSAGFILFVYVGFDILLGIPMP